MRILENIPLREYTTFKIGGQARYFCRVKSADDLKAALAFALVKQVPFFILGGGSNVLISDAGFYGLVAKIEIGGVEFRERGNEVLVAAGAGENWDDLVCETVKRGLWGIENLSGIPGTVGAAPVQNIGAYGVELGDVLHFVEVCDKKSGRVMKLLNNECKFAYRDSIFKNNEGSQYVIVRVALRLKKDRAPNLTYKDVAEYFSKRGIKKPTLAGVREAIIEIRSRKFPALLKVGTAGSFFKNPIVSEDKCVELKKRFPELPSFPVGKGKIKISLAWILDHVCGFRGLREGDAGVWEHQALVLVNFGNASAREVSELAKKMIDAVKEKTGIDVRPEVEFVS